MDKTEPALVPEWLKSSGSHGGSSSRNYQPASSSQTEKHCATKHQRNRSSVNSCGNDLGRSFVSDQATSSYFRRSSSGKGSSHLRSYSSVSRNRDRILDDFHDSQDKDRSILGEPRHRNYSDSLDVMLSGKSDKDILRRSQSMTYRRQDEPWPRKVANDFSNTSNNSPGNVNSLLVGGTAASGVGKTIFERDFPSLGSEEKWGDCMIGRVPSPGLSSAVQRLPSPSSDMLVADRWNSVLAEVPGLTGSSSSTSSLSSQQTGSGTAPSLAQSSTGLNMAEAVALIPSRANSTPQFSVDTQRMEELAIRQSKLIPVIPSTSKSLERGKSRQQHSQSALAQLRSGSGKHDTGRVLNPGKLLVLKPSRENGVSATAKDLLSPKNGVKIQSSPSLLPSSTSVSASPTASKSPSTNQNLAGSERKLTASSKILEKRPSSHAQSRNDFFNLIKQKSSSIAPATSTNSDRSVSPTVSEKSDDVMTEAVSKECKHGSSLDDSFSSLSVENGSSLIKSVGVNGSTNLVRKGEQHSVCDALIDEKEVAFLRSLGWEETAGEDEGLTEEEISAFYAKFMKESPALQLQEKIMLQLQANGVNCFGPSSQGPSSDEPQTGL